MPSAVAATVTFLKTVGLAVGGLTISAGQALAIGAATVVAGAVAASKLISELYKVPSIDGERSRQATVRGTVEPQKLIYGQALVSGPISFVGVAGTDNRDLYHAIVLAGHPSDSISDIYFDDERIPNGHINAAGNVTTGTFGPKGGTTICVIRKLTGSQTTADAVLDGAFSTINSAEHIGTNLTYIATKFTLTEDSQETWDKFMPNDIKALVKGKKVYDPRQDSTSDYYDATVGVATQRANDSSTWKWSENPVWCLVDYLTDDRFGMDIDLDRIDLSKAADAADICDATVSVPGGSEKRYTCNGVIFGTATHKVNINKILSSMNGMLTYTNGKYVIRAGAFEAVGSGMTLTEDNMIGPVKLKTSFERGERFNTITGTFVDPSKNYKEIEFPKVQITSALTRDNNEELVQELKLSMTNSRYMAQRIAHKLIQLSDLQKVLTFPTNLAGVNISVGDRVNVTLSEFGYTNKTFVCLGWTLSESGTGGVNLTLREDDSSSYADLAQSGYSTVTPAGGIQQGFFGVPDPSGLAATAHVESIELDWTNPANMTGIIAIEVFASPNSSWSSAVKIGETIGTQFIHDESNGADSISEGDQRYYWVRARRFPAGEGTDAVSDRNPDSDTSTVQATKGALGALSGLDTVGDSQIDDNAVTNRTIADDAVDTDQINNGAVDTDQIADDAVDITKIANTLQSTNYSQGSAGWKLTTDGTFEAGDGTFRGALTATSGSIANSVTIGGTAASTVESGAAAGATASQVNQGLALLLNQNSDGTSNVGEAALVGVDKDGVPENTDGFIIYNGDKITVERAQYSTDHTILTNVANKRGFICFDSNKTEPFATTSYGDLDVVFAWKEGDQWYYDDNASGLTFTPSSITGTQNGTDGTTTPNLLAIGWLETSTSDLILTGGLFEPIALESAPFAGDTYNSGTIGGIEITGSYIQSSNFSAGSAGFKLQSNGNLEAGNGTFRGAITATSITLEGTSIAESQLATGVQSSLGLADSALQDGDTSVNLELDDGSIAGISINSTKLYAGTGTWANSNTGFYLDNTGKFSLKDKIFFNPANNLLTVDGNITADIITAKEGLEVLGTFNASGVAAGGITRAMLSQDALDEIFGALATSVGGSNGDYKEASGSFTTSGGTVTVGTSSDKFDHGTAEVVVEFLANHYFYTTTNYTTAQAQATLNFEVSADGTFTDLTSATKTETLQFGEYDLSSYYGYTYLVYFFNGEHSKTFTTGSGNDIPDSTELQFRVRVSGVGTAFTSQTVPFTVEANEGVTGVVSTGGNADTLDNLDSTKFLRSDADDTFDADLIITGDLSLQGALNITGDINSYNVTDLDVTDKTITVNSGNTQALSNGAGLIVDRGTAADASITWDETNDTFDFSHAIDVIGIISTATASSIGIRTAYGGFAQFATDSQIDIVSSSGGTWGSAINLVEGNNTSNTNVWSIARKTTGGSGDSSLHFTFGTQNQHNNTTRLSISSTGNGTFGGTVTWSGGSSTNANTAYDKKINSISFASANGNLTLTRQDGTTAQTNLDGRYLTSYTETDTLDSVTDRGATTTNAISVGSLTGAGSNNVYAATFTGATGPSVTSLGLNVKTLDGANDVALLVEKTDGTDLFKITGQGVGSFSQRISVQSQDITGTRIQNWQTAYGWGDHSAAGYFETNDNITVGTISSGGITSSGNVTAAGLTVDTNTLHVDATNNRVGMGTTSPVKTLALQWSSAATDIAATLSGASAGSGLLLQNTSTSGNTYSNLDFRARDADGRIVYQYDGATNKGDFHFVTDSLGSPTSRLTIKNNGDISVVSGALTFGSTTVIDSSRNITSIKSVELEGHLPTDTSNKLYRQGSSLYWNGGVINTSGNSGVFLANGGDSSAPSFSFTSDTNTGMYADVADTLRFATGGQARATINATGLGVTGTVGASTGFKIGLTQWMDSSLNISNVGTIDSGKITAPNIDLEETSTSTAEIRFIDTDTAINFALRLNGENLDFYEPEDADKLHVRIIDDSGLNAVFGLRTGSGDGTTRIDGSGNATFGTITHTGDYKQELGANSAPSSTDVFYIGGDNLGGADASMYLGNRGDGTGYGWRLYYHGSGGGNLNDLSIQSENLGSPVNVLRFNQDGAATFANDIKIGSGTQTENADANISIREGNAFAGFDFHSTRTSGNIGGLRWYSTSSSSVPEAQLLVETDGALRFYNGGSGAQERFSISSTGSVSCGGVTSSGSVSAASTLVAPTVSGGQFRASYGSTTAPAYTFKNDDDTGMWGAVGQVKFAVGGSNRMTIGASSTTVSGRISVLGDIQAGTVPQTVIDSSRNLTNIGTISSGAITSSSTIRANDWFRGASNTNTLYSDNSNGTIIQTPSNTNDNAGLFRVRDGLGVVHFSLNTNTNVASFHGGAISSGAITSSGGGSFAADTSITGGRLTITDDTDAIRLRSSSTGVGVNINFSDQAPTPSQQGNLTFKHLNTESYGSGAAFILDSTESLTVLADGRLMFKDGLYVKPSSGTGAGTQIIDASRNVTIGTRINNSLGNLLDHDGTSNYIKGGGGTGVLYVEASQLRGQCNATFYKAGTNNVQTQVLCLGSNSTRPVLQFSEGTGTGLTDGMSLEYNGNGSGDTNFMTINSVAGSSVFKVYSGGDVHCSGDLIMSGSNNFLVIENSAENNAGILFNDLQAGAYPAASSQRFAIQYHSGNETLIMGHDDDSYAGFNFGKGGSLTCSGNVTAYSDERLKDDIETLDGSKVYEMRGVSFTKDGKAGSGVVAQELEQVAPELVHDGEYKSVAYGNLVGYLIEAVKGQREIIDNLTQRIEELENGNHKDD